MAYIPSALREGVFERAQHRCEYCQSPELITGGPLHIEHILPEALGGPTTLDNLALSCAFNMNHSTIVQARSMWMRLGIHPPSDG